MKSLKDAQSKVNEIQRQLEGVQSELKAARLSLRENLKDATQSGKIAARVVTLQEQERAYLESLELPGQELADILAYQKGPEFKATLKKIEAEKAAILKEAESIEPVAKDLLERTRRLIVRWEAQRNLCESEDVTGNLPSIPLAGDIFAALRIAFKNVEERALCEEVVNRKDSKSTYPNEGKKDLRDEPRFFSPTHLPG